MTSWKTKYYLGLFFILSACSNGSLKEYSDLEVIGTGIPVEGKLVLMDSVLINEEDSYFGLPLTFLFTKNYDFSLSTMEDGQVFSFDSLGNRVVHFDLKKTPEGDSGKVMIAFDFNMAKNSIYVLFKGVNSIYQYSLEDSSLIDKTPLAMPSNMECIIFPVFKWVEEQNSFVIGTGFADYTSDKEFFEETKLITLFESNGNYIRSFGKFPEYFPEKIKFDTWVGLHHTYVGDDFIYLLFGNRPEIYKYSYEGNLLTVIGQKSDKMDYNIRTFGKEGLESPQGSDTFNDLYYGLAKDEEQDIFYYEILALDRKHEAFNSTQANEWLMKYDATNDQYTEVKMPFNYVLLEQVKDGLITFYSPSNLSDDKYLVYAKVE